MAVLEGGRGRPTATDPVGSAIGKMVRVLPGVAGRPVAALRQVPTRRTARRRRAPSPT